MKIDKLMLIPLALLGVVPTAALHAQSSAFTYQGLFTLPANCYRLFKP